MKAQGLRAGQLWLFISRRQSGCLVSCDHINRRSMALFSARSVLDELIGGLPPRSSHRLQHTHKLQPMSSRIHPKARTIPKIWQEIKDSGLSDREAAKVFNIARAMAAKRLKRDDVQDRSRQAHTLAYYAERDAGGHPAVATPVALSAARRPTVHCPAIHQS